MKKEEMERNGTIAVALLLAARERGEFPVVTDEQMHEAQASDYRIRCIGLGEGNLRIELQQSLPPTFGRLDDVDGA